MDATMHRVARVELGRKGPIGQMEVCFMGADDEPLFTLTLFPAEGTSLEVAQAQTRFPSLKSLRISESEIEAADATE